MMEKIVKQECFVETGEMGTVSPTTAVALQLTQNPGEVMSLMRRLVKVGEN